MNEELKQIFLEEASDILVNLDANMQLWHSNLDSIAKITDLQRDLHTLKGGALMIKQQAIGNLAHELESLYQSIVKKTLKPNTEIFDLAQKTTNRIIIMIQELKDNAPISIDEDVISALRAYSKLDENLKPTSRENTAKVSPEVINTPIISRDGEEKKKIEIIRVKATSLESLNHLLSENSVNISQMDNHLSILDDHLNELERVTKRLNEQSKKLEFATSLFLNKKSNFSSKSKDTSFDILEMDEYSEAQQLTAAISETTSDLYNINKQLLELKTLADQTMSIQSRISGELVDNVTETRLVPFSQVSPRLLSLSLNTANELQKQVKFELTGAEIEIDRLVLDKVVPCLEHLVRNAIDHGIELPDVRAQQGKNPVGLLTVRLTNSGQEIIIELQDDGHGIDLEVVKNKALKLDIIKPNQSYSDEEILHCIFQPGFTTKEQVTSISGRGIGMDVVYSEIKKIGGTTQIISEQGHGTRILLKIPMTLSLYRALFLSNKSIIYGISVTNIEGITRLSHHRANLFLQKKAPRFEYNGQFYRLIYLNHVINDLDEDLPLKKFFPVVLLKTFPAGIGIIVDSLIGSREIVIKALGPQFTHLESLAGATLALDGQVNLILDAPALASKAKTLLARGLVDTAKFTQAAPLKPESLHVVLKVLIIDDSITVRKVTANLLERHNCEVITAKDGIDGLEKLSQGRPNIILLDVEMPRMDGFEFTETLKADPHYASIPIIMITSRTGSKHTEKAKSLGVQHIISKPYQDQALLDSISQLTGFIL